MSRPRQEASEPRSQRMPAFFLQSLKISPFLTSRAGFMASTLFSVSQENSIRIAAMCCLTVKMHRASGTRHGYVKLFPIDRAK
jgi:hypothetical protein